MFCLLFCLFVLVYCLFALIYCLFVCLVGWLVCLLAWFICLFLLLLLLLLLSPDCQNANSKMTSIEVLKLMLDSCSSGCPGGGRFRFRKLGGGFIFFYRWWFQIFCIYTRWWFQIFCIYTRWWFQIFCIYTRWWFQIFFFGHPYLGKIPILTNIFFRLVETTNQEVFHKLLCRFFEKIQIIQGSLNYPTHFWGMKTMQNPLSDNCLGWLYNDPWHFNLSP